MCMCSITTQQPVIAVSVLNGHSYHSHLVDIDHLPHLTLSFLSPFPRLGSSPNTECRWIEGKNRRIDNELNFAVPNSSHYKYVHVFSLLSFFTSFPPASRSSCSSSSLINPLHRHTLILSSSPQSQQSGPLQSLLPAPLTHSCKGPSSHP